MEEPSQPIHYDLNCPWETLDPWQREYINAPPEQSCFLLCGRQVGKTAAMAIKAVELCIHHFKKGENILLNSVTEKQAYRTLARAEAYAKVKYPKQIILKGKDKPTMHKIIFKSGAGIYCYAAGETGEGLRGDTIKKLMTDEGARMSEAYYIATIPMLSVSKGSHDIASTPCGKTDKDGNELFFYKCSKDPFYKHFYVSAEDCPRHQKDFLSRQREIMPKLEYAQEYLAMFLDELQQLFPDELISKVSVIQRSSIATSSTCVPLSSPLGDFYLGVDIARLGADQSTFAVLERIKNEKLRMTGMEITTKTHLTDTIDKIKELDKVWKLRKAYIDSSGVGGGVFDVLLKDPQMKNKVISIENASRSLDRDDKYHKKILKEDLYRNLIWLMEAGKIELFKDPEIAASLKSVQFERLDEGKVRIFGSNTHIAEALVRAAWCWQDKSLNIWFASTSQRP